MKFTGIIVPFLVASAQASLPYNLRDTFDARPRVPGPRHLKNYYGQQPWVTGTTQQNPGATGTTQQIPWATGTTQKDPWATTTTQQDPEVTTTTQKDPEVTTTPQGYPTVAGPDVPYPTKPDNGYGVEPVTDPADPKQGDGYGSGKMSILPYPPSPTSTASLPPPASYGVQPPKDPKTTLSTSTVYVTQSQSPQISGYPTKGE